MRERERARETEKEIERGTETERQRKKEIERERMVRYREIGRVKDRQKKVHSPVLFEQTPVWLEGASLLIPFLKLITLLEASVKELLRTSFPN